ncbi:hypothetical protein ACFXPX_11155 [Kitasatospora sp. NPDC059146]|uniref:hypothetical protein n=1 Tax=unclassified Kitasatospora TaxID=2633591 RepID=UPI0036AB2E5F
MTGHQQLLDPGPAAATFQIQALLSTAETEPAAAGRTALVTAVDRDGAVGCAVLRLLAPATVPATTTPNPTAPNPTAPNGADA